MRARHRRRRPHGGVEDLGGALGKLNVVAREKDQLLGALAPMKAQIVEKP
jgi:hypothetical protein